VGRRRTLAFVVIACTAASCATQADLQDIRREQRGIRTQLADTRASLESMDRNVATVRGRVDESRFTSRRESESRLDALEARVATLEQGRGGGEQARATVPSAEQAGGGGGSPPAIAPARPAGGATGEGVATADLAREESQQPPEQYQKALALVRQGEYDRAVQLFREFLRTNADSPLAANAHYWIGESYYALGDYSQAILQLNQVRQNYPKSDRVPPALLKIGLAFLQMGNKNEARLAFQKVVNDYPSSAEAAQAREKLRSLGA
jgi:tol-pal system protein YbgF